MSTFPSSHGMAKREQSENGRSKYAFLQISLVRAGCYTERIKPFRPDAYRKRPMWHTSARSLRRTATLLLWKTSLRRADLKFWMVRIVLAAGLMFSLAGCDKRGENERAVDAEIAKVERSNASQSDKDSTIILLDAAKTQARQMDKQIAAMPPEQRDAYERIKRMQQSGETYTLPSYRETSLSLGLNYDPVNRSNATKVGIAFGTGIYVTGVVSGGAADIQHFQTGDIIDTADGHVLDGSFSIGEALYQHARGNPLQGKPVSFHVCRNDRWSVVLVYPTQL